MSAPKSVLIIEDEPQMRRFLRAGLEIEGYDVREAPSGGDGIKLAIVKSFDLIVLDLGLPDMDGKEVIARLKSWSSVPIIVLSVRAREEERVAALDAGADDFVPKPFGMLELLARTRAALRRSNQAKRLDPVVTVGDVSIDLAHREVRQRGEPVQLTPKEYRMLEILAQHAGKVVTHNYLLREIWGMAHEESVHYLRVLVRKLRHKIEPHPALPTIVLTELGVGYRLASSGDA